MSKNKICGLRAVIYCRVAANNDICADENRIAIDHQKAICQNYIEGHGYQVVESIIDFAAGMTLERDGMNRLIQIIESDEIDAVIVKDYDRIARNFYALEEFYNLCRKHNVELISALLGNTFCDPPIFVDMSKSVSKTYLSTKI